MAVSMVASKGSNSTRMLNPWVLHLQKLGLELKCPLCLDFYVRPMLLPCNHIFCHGCLPESSQLAMPCLLCQKQYACGDIRPAPFMENLVSIYTSLDATFYANLPQNVQSVGVRVLKKCTASHVNEAAKVSAETVQEVVGSGQVKESDKFGMELKSSSGFERSNQSNIGTSLGNAEVLDVRIAEMDMNHVENSSQGSPSGHSSDPNKNQTPSNCSSKRLGKEVRDNSTSSKKFNGCKFEIEGFVRELKRQKQTADESPSQLFMETDFDRWNTKSEKQPNSSVKVLDDNCISKFICGFCLSSTVSEDTGEMLHCVNGRPVTDDNAANSTDVVHVHRKCFEWSPQGYFEGDTVKNLDKELARSAKLKCCRCGLKGAALGCYAKSCRRTYHVPCAAQVSKCRWDCDNYLMLCPAHASLRFPSEKSNRSSKRPSALNRKPSHTEQSVLWHASFSGAKDWVLCGSALAADDKYLLMKFATKIGATVSKTWTPDITHVIAATDEQGACTRTFKVLMAVLHGRWVLKINWIRACMKAMQAVGEEPYEVRLDNHGCCNGSKLGRLRVSNNDPKLFTGLKFYFVGEIAPSFANDLEELILAAGGGVVESKESLMQQSDPTTAKTLIVYNPEPQEGCQLGEEVSMYWQKLNEAEELAASSASQIINHAWLLESIAACKLQPLINLATTTTTQ